MIHKFTEDSRTGNRVPVILGLIVMMTWADCKRSRPFPCEVGAKFSDEQQEQTETAWGVSVGEGCAWLSEATGVVLQPLFRCYRALPLP